MLAAVDAAVTDDAVGDDGDGVIRRRQLGRDGLTMEGQHTRGIHGVFDANVVPLPALPCGTGPNGGRVAGGWPCHSNRC